MNPNRLNEHNGLLPKLFQTFAQSLGGASTVEECRPLHCFHLFSDNNVSVTSVHLSGITITHVCAFEFP